MSKIGKEMAPYYEELALEFCIAQHDIMTIRANALTKVNPTWHGLNAVVDTWLRGSYDRYSEVKPNERWLVDAVKKFGNIFGDKLAKGTYIVVFYAIIIVMNIISSCGIWHMWQIGNYDQLDNLLINSIQTHLNNYLFYRIWNHNIK